MSTTQERPGLVAGMDGRRRTGKGEHALVPDVEVRTYYDRPVLKQPTWKHWIPEYLFLGGLSAGSSLLAFGATLTGRRTLARRARIAAVGAIGAGTAALIADLGRPARAANMLRVAKVTSPLNVGSWLLTFYAPAAGVAAAADVFGVLPGVRTAAQVGAAVLAPGVATYTAVVFADTSLPAWHGARRELPFLFAAGAGASAGALGLLLAPAEENGPARRWAVAGALGEVAVSSLMERRLGEQGEPYRHGRAGWISKVANACALAGAAVGLRRGGRRGGALLAGALVFTGSLLERYAVMEAGKQSAAEPKYVVKAQRERLAEREREAPPA
ncbi:MAG TPA: NrfD/PsrC family molybdoenzyme membrane anchor subunit [Acidimicrobiia bacterium]